MADVKRVGVLGCGLMGSGIAQVAAAAGYETIVRDVSKELLGWRSDFCGASCRATPST